MPRMWPTVFQRECAGANQRLQRLVASEVSEYVIVKAREWLATRSPVEIYVVSRVSEVLTC